MSDTNSVTELREALAELGDMDPSQAMTLPPACYTSKDFLELEKKEIFRKEWICLGRVDEIPKSGDYFTTELVDEPLLVVRGKDGNVRVLSNVCRHRSSVIAEGDGNTKNFVCPYHAWTYATDGQLLRAPYMDQVKGFDVKGCRLPEFATEIWGGFIYVNLDGKAKPLAPRLKALEPFIENYHMDDMVHLMGEEDVWGANWKCLAENFMEGYHLSTLHYTGLHKITPTRLCKKIPGGEGYTGYISGYPAKLPQRKPYHPDLTDAEKRYSMMVWIYPSHVFALGPDATIYLCLSPRAADQVAIKFGRAMFGSKANSKPSRKATKGEMSTNQTMTEDREQIERLQAGLNSRYAERYPLGPPDLEGTVWDMFQYLAGRLAPKSPAKPKMKRAAKPRLRRAS
jgi:choline monooxygenase